LVAILSFLGGGHASSKSAGSSASTSSQAANSNKGSKHSQGASAVVGPADTPVAVFNDTETAGLAHRLAGELRGHGYTQANALSARPSGSYPTTLVEYASGHRTEAQQVAHALGVTQVQPMEATVTSLAGSSLVAVIVGANQAAIDGEASGSGGEASGGGGEATGGSGEASGSGGAGSATGQ